MGNSEYTRLWTGDFGVEEVQNYDRKFTTRWEKNIKHRQQIIFIRKYLQDWMHWCDAPIGSGRLMRELQCKKMSGYDISDAFLTYNQNRGIACEKGDIFQFGERYQDEFDLITSLHTIFAFPDYKSILAGFVQGLKQGGILIVDIPNKDHSEATQVLKTLFRGTPDSYPNGMNQAEILNYFDALGCDVIEIRPHDFWDNYFILKWRFHTGNILLRRLIKYAWKLLNILYFHTALNRYMFAFEEGRPVHQFVKYLVAVRKR
jgi:SAM-dependent methyltransferase